MSKPRESKFLRPLKRWLWLVPQVEPPPPSHSLEDKMMYTGGCLLLYLLLCGCPLCGIPADWSANADPLHAFRPMLGARSGSLMELGISPMVSAQFVLQLLAGSRMIAVDLRNERDKAQLHAIQKLVSLLIALGEAVAFVASGAYGHWLHELGTLTSLFIVAQLFLASLLLLLLDEVIQRGWGLGSGTSLFIATNICSDILWRCASPLTHETARGVQYEGALVALCHLSLTGSSLRWALEEAFYRAPLPNLGELLATVLLLALTVLLQGLRVELPVKSQKLRGQQSQVWSVSVHERVSSRKQMCVGRPSTPSSCCTRATCRFCCTRRW